MSPAHGPATVTSTRSALDDINTNRFSYDQSIKNSFGTVVKSYDKPKIIRYRCFRQSIRYIHGHPPGGGEDSDPYDPSYTSLIPGQNQGDEGDHIKNKQSATPKTPTASAAGKDGLDGVDSTGKLRSASPGECNATVGSATKTLPYLTLSNPPLIGGYPTIQVSTEAAVLRNAASISNSVAQISTVPQSVGSGASTLHHSAHAPPQASAPSINDQSSTRTSNSGLPFTGSMGPLGNKATMISRDPYICWRSRCNHR